MTELLNNAWMGWQGFTEAGKLAALLAASLIFLWFSYRRLRQKSLLVYTTVMTVCCIVPVTASMLMLYQTRFYDYEWIWSAVPMTAVIAYGAVSFLMVYWPDLKKADWKRGVPALILLLTILLLSGGMGRVSSESENRTQERAAAEMVLTAVSEQMYPKSICLWAPREILEYVRVENASIELLYGRNMWDSWLNAYSYDTYSGELRALYEWMEETAAEGRTSNLTLRVHAALEAGANCILLPESLDAEIVKKLEQSLQLQLSRIEGYYLLTV